MRKDNEKNETYNIYPLRITHKQSQLIVKKEGKNAVIEC